MQDLTLGRNVKRLREAAGLTQQTLAARAGISLKTLSNIETGKDCTVGTLGLLVEHLGVTLADLFESSDTEDDSIAASG